jgi:hypothetical protein
MTQAATQATQASEASAFRDRWIEQHPSWTLEQLAEAWLAHKTTGEECDGPASGPELLRVVQAEMRTVDEARGDFPMRFAAAKDDVCSAGVFVSYERAHGDARERRPAVVRVIRTIVDANAKGLTLRREAKDLPPVDAAVVATTWIRPYISRAQPLVGQSLELRVYRERPSCGAEGSFDEVRKNMLAQLNDVLGTRENESLEWLGGEDVVLLTPELRARLTLFLWIKLGHHPAGEGTREIAADARSPLRRLYMTQLRGELRNGLFVAQ